VRPVSGPNLGDGQNTRALLPSPVIDQLVGAPSGQRQRVESLTTFTPHQNVYIEWSPIHMRGEAGAATPADTSKKARAIFWDDTSDTPAW